MLTLIKRMFGGKAASSPVSPRAPSPAPRPAAAGAGSGDFFFHAAQAAGRGRSAFSCRHHRPFSGRSPRQRGAGAAADGHRSPADGHHSQAASWRVREDVAGQPVSPGPSRYLLRKYAWKTAAWWRCRSPRFSAMWIRRFWAPARSAPPRSAQGAPALFGDKANPFVVAPMAEYEDDTPAVSLAEPVFSPSPEPAAEPSPLRFAPRPAVSRSRSMPPTADPFCCRWPVFAALGQSPSNRKPKPWTAPGWT